MKRVRANAGNLKTRELREERVYGAYTWRRYVPHSTTEILREHVETYICIYKRVYLAWKLNENLFIDKRAREISLIEREFCFFFLYTKVDRNLSRKRCNKGNIAS